MHDWNADHACAVQRQRARPSPTCSPRPGAARDVRQHAERAGPCERRGTSVKALAVSSKSRSRRRTSPAVRQSGVRATDVGVWFGVLTVAGHTARIVQRLNTES